MLQWLLSTHKLYSYILAMVGVNINSSGFQILLVVVIGENWLSNHNLSIKIITMLTY